MKGLGDDDDAPKPDAAVAKAKKEKALKAHEAKKAVDAAVAVEKQSQKEHDAFLNDSSSNKASKTTEMNHKTTKRTDKEGALVATKKDLAGTQQELDAALEYYDKLKPSCVDAGVSYEDRVARRKEEIQSLQEALNIMNGDELAFMQKK